VDLICPVLPGAFLETLALLRPDVLLNRDVDDDIVALVTGWGATVLAQEIAET
jgi:hypothetical protein